MGQDREKRQAERKQGLTGPIPGNSNSAIRKIMSSTIIPNRRDRQTSNCFPSPESYLCLPKQKTPAFRPQYLFWLLLFLPLSAYCADTIVFDFKDDTSLSGCRQFVDEKSKSTEPALKFSLSEENAAAGSRALKLEFDGGFKPCVALKIPEASANDFFSPTLIANVFVSRACVVGFRLLPEGGVVGKCWEKLARLEPGMNKVNALLVPDIKAGAPKELHIYMYTPKKGETAYFSRIGISSTPIRVEGAYSQFNPGGMIGGTANFARLEKGFKILGTDIEAGAGKDLVSAWKDLGLKIRNIKKWPSIEAQGVEQSEQEFRAKFEEIKKDRPKAVMSLFRQDDAGFDPANPSQKYSGWSDAELQGHDPAAGYANNAMNCRGSNPSSELFVRRRCCLMKAELATIPAGSEILKATLLLVRTGKADGQQYKNYSNTVWAAEACNRKWSENEVNCIEYAKDKFWKEIDGMYWNGDDPDFLPLIISCQVGCGFDGAQRWDFTEAVKYWTGGKNENNGFCLYGLGAGGAFDYMHIHTKEAVNLKDRPALLVIYEPK